MRKAARFLTARVAGAGRLCVIAFALTGGLGGCAREAPPGSGPHPQADRVAVVANRASPVSLRLAEAYAGARGLPRRAVIEIDVEATDEIDSTTYRTAVETPVRRALEERGLREKVDFLLLTKGVPLRVREGGWSVDALLGAMDLHLPLVFGRSGAGMAQLANPYFARREPFERSREGFYLVCRLDGDSEADAQALIARADSAQAWRGPFLLDLDPHRDRSGYGGVNAAMRRAAIGLRAGGHAVILEETDAFAGSEAPLAGYMSWGSNDNGYRRGVYRSLRFLPGALVETAVSTSARTFEPTEEGQSRIADLIAAGATGARGYVSEPTVAALARPDILFERYTAGFTLAESYGMASPLLQWKGIVIGDPLCAPYPRAGGQP